MFSEVVNFELRNILFEKIYINLNMFKSMLIMVHEIEIQLNK